GAGTSGVGVGGGVGMPTFVLARLRILNMCPQFVHLTVTPPGLSRLSSSSYSVWHFWQRTYVISRCLAVTVPRRYPWGHARSGRSLEPERTCRICPFRVITLVPE